MDFEKKILEEMEKMYPDAKVEIVDIKKTNVTYRGLTIREEGSMVSPSINLNDLRERYESGMSIEQIISSVDSIYQEHKGDMSVVPEMTRENFLAHTTLKLINREKNPEKLEDTPYMEWADLIAIPVYVQNGPDGVSTIVETKSLLANLGITPEEALETGMKAVVPKVSNLQDVLFAMMQDEHFDAQELSDVIDATDPNMLYLITNQNKFYGAAAVLQTDKLSEICDLLDDDIYIIPSSIHEVLLIAAADHDPEFLCKMVHEVNSECVRADEILSENVYLFDREQKQVKTCVAEIGDDYGV